MSRGLLVGNHSPNVVAQGDEICSAHIVLLHFVTYGIGTA